MTVPIDRPDTARANADALARNLRQETGSSRPTNGTLVLITLATVAVAVLPGVATYANVEHLDVKLVATAPRVPLAHLVSMVASAALVLTCVITALKRGHADRDVSGAILLMIGLVFPFVITPGMPQPHDMLSVSLAAVVMLAVWHIGASVSELKWVAISGSLIGVYSMVGGLISPKHMMYGLESKKALVGNIQLAGPFGHSNTLGLYCLLSLALVPLIVDLRWRVVHGLILSATLVASASRTALLVAGALALWWILCWLRSVVSIRFLGTVMVVVSAAAVVVLPFVNWDPNAFTGRAYIWTESLHAWQESRIFGLGVNWFTTAVQSSATVASWGFVRSGHNLVINTLVISGLAGICVLALVLAASMRSALALDIRRQQIAAFGYLIAFLLVSATEAIWILLPNEELFPVVGFVFAVLIVARRSAHAGGQRVAADLGPGNSVIANHSITTAQF